MAEEYRPNINRFKNKSGDGEDPILVAQRFLNIFRQLHIFDEKRHAEFKAQILALPPEIRNSFNVLPGGQALQEYADEVVREAGGQPVDNAGAAPAQGNILSAAIAESSAPQQPQQATPAAPQPVSAAPQIIQTGPGKIVADEAFAQTLAQAFAKALQFSDNNKKEDIKELIAAIRESKNTAAPIQPQESPAAQIQQPAAGSPAESRLVADEEFAQTLARSFAKALQFSDANKKEDIKELIAAIRDSKTTAEPASRSEENSSGQALHLTADENFAQMLAQSFTQALENVNAGQKGDMRELIEAIKGIRIDIPQPVAQSQPSLSEAPTSSSSQLNIDSNFAQILAQSFASALEMSNAGRKEEMQELIAAIRESAVSKAPLQGGELQATPAASQPQAPMTVIADESFAHTISQSFSSALETFGQSQANGFKALAEAFKESSKEIRPAAGSDFAAVENQPAMVKVIADEGFASTIAKSFSSAISFSDQKRMAEMEKLVQAIQANQPHVVYTAGESAPVQNATPVFSNDNLVKEITEALSSAISSSKTETIELAKAVKETQNELARILLQNNIQNNTAAANNNANNIHINNAPIILPIDEIVGKVVEAQSGFLKEMSHNQTAELSSVISAALKESQELSSRTIIDAIKAFQEENLKLIRAMPVQIKEVRVQETPVSDISQAAVQTIAPVREKDELSYDDQENTPKTDEEQFSAADIAEPFEESKKKKKKKKKKKSKQEESLQEPLSIPQSVQEDSAKGKTLPESSAFLDVSLFGDTEDEDINSLLPKTSDDFGIENISFDEDETAPISDGVTDTADFTNNTPESPVEPDEDFVFEQPEEAVEENLSEDEEDLVPSDEELSAQEENFLSENPVSESDPTEEISTESAPLSEEAAEDEALKDDDVIQPTKKTARNSLFDDINRSIKNSSRIDFDRYIKSEFESATIDEDEVSSADWGFTTAPEPEPEAPVSEYKGWTSENEEDENGTENQDWEWEYEEESGDGQENQAVSEGIEGQDWEWEYEEESADGTEGQDWVWEYEEVPADNEAAALQSAAENSDQDWEWVYEENYDTFTVYGQDIDRSSPMQLTAGILIEDGRSNSRQNTQKRLVLAPADKISLPDGIMIAELQNANDQTQPYPGNADI